MPERDVCLTVSAPYWLELVEGAEIIEQGSTQAPGQYEYKLRCRIVGELPSAVIVRIYEWADVSGRFRSLPRSLDRTIPKSKVITEEPW